ncbi:MAG: SRPBCC domain-containing protein [Flavobacterium sp. JAD_PAG50586_2]|nr:MAG: SRPBCC domain-containing protein [Flavobacterium sp. JAD_PAG50586_2]
MDSNQTLDIIINKDEISATIKRKFAANRDLVWEAWTNPDILDQWWAPKPFTSKTKEMDFKVGGRRLYAMVSPEGNEGWSAQEYTSIHPKDSFRFLSFFTDSEGTPNSALGPSEWNLDFSEHNGNTTVNIVIKRQSLEELEKIIAMGFKEGFAATLGYLDNYFESLKK